MPSTLDQIVGEARARVEAQKRTPLLRDRLERDAAEHSPRGFRAALESISKSGPAVIAELKKASPSKGLIRPNFEVQELAVDLAEAGAAALSVLTEEKHFQGSLANLQKASAATKLPCLRKDFIVDEIQIIEARANRADAILLIVAALRPDELVVLHRAAQRAGLDTLCEIHDDRELQPALDAGCEIIGVNSRNLHSFDVSLRTAEELSAKLPPNVLRVAESGIYSAEDICRLRAGGYQAFLIGEALMRAPDPGAALRGLLGTGSDPGEKVARPAVAMRRES